MLEPSMIELSWENSQPLKTVNYFRKKSSSWMLVMSLYAPLKVDRKQGISGIYVLSLSFVKETKKRLIIFLFWNINDNIF